MKEILSSFNNLSRIINKDNLQYLTTGDGIFARFDTNQVALTLADYQKIVGLKKMAKSGLIPFALLNSAENTIVNPAGHSPKIQTIKEQLMKMEIQVVDAHDLYSNINVITFLRETGKLIDVKNLMPNNNLQDDYSFAQFSLPLLHGFEFWKLYQNYHIKGALTTVEQTAGAAIGLHLIQTQSTQDAGIALILNELAPDYVQSQDIQTEQMLWIDEKYTSAFRLYQFFLNQRDADLEKLFQNYTYLNTDAIVQIIRNHYQEPQKRSGQKQLASQVVHDLYGAKRADDAKKVTTALFDSPDSLGKLTLEQFELLLKELPVFDNQKQKRSLLDTLVAAKICTSRREGREFLNQGAIQVDGIVKLDEHEELLPQYFGCKYLLVKKGKKFFYIIKY